MLKVEATGLITYPDVAVTCDPPRLAAHQGLALANPTVLFEVLSESTEAYDRGDKFAQYREIPSLRAYVLISQWEPRVEVFTWESGQPITLRVASGLGADAEIRPLNVRLPLAELYHDVTLSPRIRLISREQEI